MDGGDIGDGLSMRIGLSGLFAMPDEVFQILYGRHDAGGALQQAIGSLGPHTASAVLDRPRNRNGKKRVKEPEP